MEEEGRLKVLEPNQIEEEETMSNLVGGEKERREENLHFATKSHS